MNPSDDPFAEMEKLLDKICVDYVFVDFHGETTSEKKPSHGILTDEFQP